MNSFPQARDITELLLAIDPTASHELRDRGLLAYHLNDFSSALRDLQTYLALAPAKPADEAARKDHERIVEHVKTLRRRVATFN
jgi:regulator of sirC expression with transglutaminase-like and TPR domain